MNKKMSMKLLELSTKYSIIHEILDSLKNNKGRWWTDAESKAEPPLWPTKESKIIFTSGESNAIVDDGEGTLYFGDCGQFECPISDPELLELIQEIRPKVKKVAKKEATPKKNYKNATWIDVFKRVADYLDGTRYALNVGGIEEWEDCSEDDEVSMKVCDEEEDREGEQWLNWDSVKDFLTKPLSGNHCNTNTDGCANIFESVACWESQRYKVEVGSPYLIWLIDTIGELGKVNIKKCDTPDKLMKALDKAGVD